MLSSRLVSFEPFEARTQPPARVSQNLVASGDGLPFATWTRAGSPFSSIQKNRTRSPSFTI